MSTQSQDHKTPDDLSGPRHWGRYCAETPGAAMMLFTQLVMLVTLALSFAVGQKIGLVNPWGLLEILVSHGAEVPLDFVVSGDAVGRGVAPILASALWIIQSLPIAALIIWALGRKHRQTAQSPAE
ncbi:MAG: hypothetical protein Alpg2KO_21550 [Alphaproteobacteria bacterium]